eukprot:gene6506-13139_t
MTAPPPTLPTTVMEENETTAQIEIVMEWDDELAAAAPKNEFKDMGKDIVLIEVISPADPHK